MGCHKFRISQVGLQEEEQGEETFRKDVDREQRTVKEEERAHNSV